MNATPYAFRDNAADVFCRHWQTEMIAYPGSLVAKCRKSPDFADRIIADGLPSVEDVGGVPLVMSSGAPLKVFDTVVRLDAVDVIYHIAPKWPRKKRSGDKTVDMDLIADPHIVVSDLLQAGPDDPVGHALHGAQRHHATTVGN